MNDTWPLISIIIPVYNEERYLSACLNSLSMLNYPAERLELILVDNGSTDGTLDIARQYDVSIYEHPGVKVGAVRNFGVANAKGELVAFIDSDCIAEPDWLYRGIDSLGDQYSVAGGLYLLRENPAWIERYWILDSAPNIAYQTSLVGGCIFARREAFDAVGGFDERMSAGEDTDLTLRLKSSGYEVVIDPHLSVVHLGYPDTISAFVKRQMWLAENYYQNFPAVLLDKVFILTNIFLLGFLLLPMSVILGMRALLCGGLMISLPPLVLSIKRLLRYRIVNMGIGGLLSVYSIDLLYLIGRVMGSMRSVRRIFALEDGTKSDRR